MLRVGLTGGMASGKSTVGRMMEDRGAYLIQADLIAHELMVPGTEVYKQVVLQFGGEIVNQQAGGVIDRKKLADAAFGCGRVAELNEIVHPAVIQRQEKWMAEIGRKDATGIAVVEAALILEAGAGKRFDRLVIVTCPESERIQRFAAHIIRMKSDADAEKARAEIKRRMATQTTDSEKTKAADYVIDNSGPLAQTENQVDRLMEELRPLAAAK